MNFKVATFVALLAAASLVLIPLGAADSSGDGGVQRGEGAGEGFSMEYTSSPIPYVEIHFVKAPSSNFMLTFSGPEFFEMGLFPSMKDITIGLEKHPLLIGEYSILITGESGERIDDCFLRVYSAGLVSFDANGGTGSMDKQYAEIGKGYILPENGFGAPQDMVFDLWTIGSTHYEPGSSVVVTGDMTVTASWKEPNNSWILPIIIGAVVLLAILAVALVAIGRRRI
ncbi:MAG: InlB B-repeat-containing protein [Candidatus Methanomethylophilaceae archaeon]|nr:InlB B-repeat-containing protein [Candidatus Methanomethylophilaceae archaeon]